MRVVALLLFSLPLGVALLFLVGYVLDVTGLMHGWGFWHGGFMLAAPVCLVAAFLLLSRLPAFRKGGTS